MLRLISALVVLIMPIVSVSTTSATDDELFLARDIWTQCGPGGCEGDEDPPPPLVDTQPSPGSQR